MKGIIKYLVDNYGVDSNTAATVLITIITFSIGLLITWLGSALSSARRRYNYKKSLRLILKEFVKSCKRQADALEPIFQQKGFLHGFDYFIPSVSNFSLNYLSQLDIQTFTDNFSCFLDRKRAKKIAKLLQQIETVRSEGNSLKAMVEFVYTKFSSYEIAYREHLDSLRKFHDDLAAQLNEQLIAESDVASYFNFIRSTFVNWVKAGKQLEIVHTYHQLVLPILEHSRKLRPNKLARGAIDACLAAQRAYNNLEKMEEVLRQDIKNSIFIYRKAYRLGTIIMKHI